MITKNVTAIGGGNCESGLSHSGTLGMFLCTDCLSIDIVSLTINHVLLTHFVPSVKWCNKGPNQKFGYIKIDGASDGAQDVMVYSYHVCTESGELKEGDRVVKHPLCGVE